MRNSLLVIGIVIILGNIAFAQSDKTVTTNQNPRVDPQDEIVDPIITQEQINNLPIAIRKPRISLQRALKIAEKYAQKQSIDLSSYFLLEGRMIQYGAKNTDKEVRWFFRWANENGTISNYLEISVSMKGEATQLPLM